MTGNEALRAAVAVLKSAGLDDPSRDSRLLLAHSLDILPDRLTLHLQDMLTKEQIRDLIGYLSSQTQVPLSDGSTTAGGGGGARRRRRQRL